MAAPPKFDVNSSYAISGSNVHVISAVFQQSSACAAITDWRKSNFLTSRLATADILYSIPNNIF